LFVTDILGITSDLSWILKKISVVIPQYGLYGSVLCIEKD
jgi:hypothetical protein